MLNKARHRLGLVDVSQVRCCCCCCCWGCVCIAVVWVTVTLGEGGLRVGGWRVQAEPDLELGTPRAACNLQVGVLANRNCCAYLLMQYSSSNGSTSQPHTAPANPPIQHQPNPPCEHQPTPPCNATQTLHANTSHNPCLPCRPPHTPNFQPQGLGTANTALVAHAGRLMALNEGDLPYALGWVRRSRPGGGGGGGGS